ncbi:hypothetical protein BDZ97DRAFT_546765 [Flammula alnicola]|nr:hypothetical protein BDZ97DRAFT_546765 [Flammula alnicola]
MTCSTSRPSKFKSSLFSICCLSLMGNLLKVCYVAFCGRLCPPTPDPGPIVDCSIFYNLSQSASFVSLTFDAVFNIPGFSLVGEMEDFGRHLGTIMTFNSGGNLWEPPITGAISCAAENFETVNFYTGSAIPNLDHVDGYN